MKLNPNCIKDILTVFESIVCQAGTTYEISSWNDLAEHEMLRKYSPDEIGYHCQQIYLSGYLYNGKMLIQGGISFMDLMSEAHAFLANLRVPAVLNAVQKFVSTVGGASLNQMATIASEMAISYLPQLLK